MYVAPADFRPDTLEWWCQGLDLTEAEADDVILAAAIAAATLKLDEHVEDHFEPEAALTIYMDGLDRRQLILPKRVRAVTSVALKDAAGAYTTSVAATSYQVVSSVDVVASTVNVSKVDLLEVSQSLPTWGWRWPCGANAVRVIGDFSWPTGSCPDEVKRAVALMVWDDLKAQDPSLGRAERMSTPGRTIEYGNTLPTGIRKVDETILRFRRTLAASVMV